MPYRAARRARALWNERSRHSGYGRRRGWKATPVRSWTGTRPTAISSSRGPPSRRASGPCCPAGKSSSATSWPVWRNTTPRRTGDFPATGTRRAACATTARRNTGRPSRRGASHRCACRRAWRPSCSCRARAASPATAGCNSIPAATTRLSWRSSTGRPWNSGTTSGMPGASGAGRWTDGPSARPRWKATRAPISSRAAWKPPARSGHGHRSNGWTPSCNVWPPARPSSCRKARTPDRAWPTARPRLWPRPPLWRPSPLQPLRRRKLRIKTAICYAAGQPKKTLSLSVSPQKRATATASRT